MGKYCFQNLEVIVTNKCNLDCLHCLRGEKDSGCISDEVIEALFDQVRFVGMLNIGGGEATLALDQVEKIVAAIIDKQIWLENFALAINGTNYSERLINLLAEVDNYIGGDDVNAIIDISYDKYHLEQIRKFGLYDQFVENVKKYSESKFFNGFRTVDNKLFREGNAFYLGKRNTVKLKRIRPVITFSGDNDKLDIKNGVCNIGPIIGISTNGTITEINASIKNQETKYNYGNVLYDDILEICLKNGAKIVKPKKYLKTTSKYIDKYISYTK